MTLVFNRPDAGPVTHALIIGCGRFDTLQPDGSANRAATVAGARQIAECLITQRDELVAPLGSVEVLLSDPAVAAGADQLGLPPFPHDARAVGDDAVDAALKASFEAAGEAWLTRCRPGDRMFFYMSSHGVAERDGSALGLLEDVGSNPNKPWAQTVNVNTLASHVPTKQTDGSWVFLDACQEVIIDLFDRVNGAQGITLMTPTVMDLTRIRVRSVGLAGSRFGGRAWAPANGDPPFFTQALLAGIGGACVEAWDGLGWVVTGNKLMTTLSRVADAALDHPHLETEPLTPFNAEVALLKVAAPRVPVAVRTKPEPFMGAALSVTADDGVNPPYVKNCTNLTWRFTVPPDSRNFTVQALFPAGVPVHPPKSFSAVPPAQIVVLTS